VGVIQEGFLPWTKFFPIDEPIMKYVGSFFAQAGVVISLSSNLFKLIQAQFPFIIDDI